MTSLRRDILHKQLAWMPKVWLAAREAHELAGSYRLTNFELMAPEQLELPIYLRSLTGIEYFSASYERVDTDRSADAPEPDLDPRLVKARLLTYSCSNSVYTFWHIMHRVLSTDPDFKGIRWMRRVPYPDFIVFDDDGDDNKIPSCNHDYFLITYQGTDRFIVDLTGAQFGWEEWLYTRKEYEENLVTWILDPEPVKVEEVIRGYNEGDGVVKLIKGVIEKCVKEAEARVTTGEGAELVYNELVDHVRKDTLEALKGRESSVDEGYESK